MDPIRFKNKCHISYLRARDPSIVSGNRRTVLNNLKMNLAEEISEIEEESYVEEPTLQNIQVYLRIKKVDALASAYVLDNNVLHCFVPEGSHGHRNIKDGHCMERTYTFSHIFGPESTQEEVFIRTVKPKLLDLINGRNFTLMTYGASGSGKTFTIVGTASEPGVIPRALEYLFGSLPKLPDCPSVKPTQSGAITILDRISSESEKNARNMLLNTLNATMDRQHVKTYLAMQHRLSSEPVADLEGYEDVSLAVWVSFAEIYNENVYDLLSPEPKGKPRTKLQLGKSNDQTYVKNLKHISVCSGLEAYQVLQYGLQNLNYASTGINSHSSRSHCIFTVKLVQAVEANHENGGYHVSYFNFCDLAGSERLKKTLNIGERLKESNNINTSLLVLGRCISLIRDSQQKNDNKIIPFRESKLTMLFQKALSGKEDTTMIVNMNPTYEMFDESMHVLNFSAIAKQITVKQVDTKLVKAKQDVEAPAAKVEYSEENWKLMELVKDLTEEIEQQRLQFEENERLVRDQNLEIFKKCAEENERRFERIIKIKEEQFELELNARLEEMKDKYESIMKQMANGSVINLDSSLEEEEEPQQQRKRCKVVNLDTSKTSVGSDDDYYAKKEQSYKDQIRELNVTVGILQADLSKCRFEQQSLLDEVKRLKEEKSEYKKQLEECLAENYTLKESIAELNLQLQTYGCTESVEDDFAVNSVATEND